MSDVEITSTASADNLLWQGKRRGEATLSVSVHWPIDEIHVGDVFRVILVHTDPTETAITLQRIEDVSA